MVPAKMFMKALVSGKAAAPLYVVYFVTERCNARCGHCLMGEWTPQEDELSLDEIERWSRAMPDFYFLLPTGGEPFLRGDLPDIVRIFSKNCGVRNAGIPTNGSLTEETADSVRRILAENPKLDLGVDVSMDGVLGDHDRIRGTEGLFEKATATFGKLQRIARENPRFNLNVALTVSSLNQKRLLPLLDYIVLDLGAGNVNHLLVRGRPREIYSLNVSPDLYHALNEKLEEYILAGKLRGYTGYGEADAINAMKIVRQKLIERTIRTGRRQVECRAGTLGAVVRAGGDVLPCELLDSRLGNLREAGFDFMKIWRSAEADSIRRKIQETKCFCTYECFLTLSILTDPLLAVKVAAVAASIKAARFRSALTGGKNV